MIVLAALSITLMFAAGCASRQRQHPSSEDITSIERPARPIGEEQSFADRIGEVGVVVLVVVVAVGGILIPIILFL